MSITLDGSNLTTNGVINSGTLQNSTSGTSIDYTGIPAGMKRVTVIFNGASTNGSSVIIVQLGSGSVVTTGYNGNVAAINAGTGQASFGNGHPMSQAGSASYTIDGSVVFVNMGGNSWVGTSIFCYNAASGSMAFATSRITLSGALGRVRITTVNGTDAFNAGTINILYE